MQSQYITIAPFTTGWDTDLQPWIAPPDSFSEIDNFHIYNGFIEKRSGYRRYGYFTHAPELTQTITGVTQANPGVITVSSATGLANGQEIMITDVDGMTELNGNTYTIGGLAGTTFNLLDLAGNNVDTTGFNAYTANGSVYVYIGCPTISGITSADPGVVTVSDITGISNGDIVIITGVGGMTEVNNVPYQVAGIAGSTFQLNDLTGNNIDTTGFTAYTSGGMVCLYPGNRIMGIDRYVASDGSQDTLTWDTKRAAVFNAASNQFHPLDAADIMDSGEEDYIWVENWQSSELPNRLYFTNGLPFDGDQLNGIRYYDSSESTDSTILFKPDIGNNRFLTGGKLLFSIQSRLVVLHTFENNGTVSSTHPQRARWCQAQGPSNWDDLTPGGGGFVDAPTGDQIISARALQNTIIVFFTNSVWTLRPVSDPALPFRWDKINDFRACSGKMASVGFDRYVAAVGVRGITATDGVETNRIDNRIELFVNNEISFDNFGKVFCQRSFDFRRTWTLYPSDTNDSDETDSALILDEQSSAFSNYKIAMNCLGIGASGIDYALEDFTSANDLDKSIEDFTEETLQDFYWQDNEENLLGGDISGVVHIMQTEGSDNGIAIDSTLTTAAWNPYRESGIECQMHYVDLFVDADKDTKCSMELFKNNETTPYTTQYFDLLPNLTYLASITNVSLTNPAAVEAPNHGLTTGDKVYIYGVEGAEDFNDIQFTITVVNDNNFTLDGLDATGFDPYTTGGLVCLREFYRTKTWKRVYAGAYGYQHRIKVNTSGTKDPIRIHAFKPKFRPRGTRTTN